MENGYIETFSYDQIENAFSYLLFLNEPNEPHVQSDWLSISHLRIFLKDQIKVMTIIEPTLELALYVLAKTFL